MTRVFISYSHDDEAHRTRVRKLADRLIEAEGLDVEIDQYHEASPPPQGWELWTERQVRDSDFTLVVCTAEYRAAFDDEKPAGSRRGVRAEAQTVRQFLYNADQHNERFVVLLFDGCGENAIPLRLQPHTRYRLPGDYEALVRQFTGQPRVVKPAKGRGRKLPPENVVSASMTSVPENDGVVHAATGLATAQPITPPPPPPPRRRWLVATLLLVVVAAGLAYWWLYLPLRELQAAQADYDHDNLDGARSRLEANPQRWENNAQAQFLLGAIAARRDEKQRAMAYYEKAFRLDSSAPQYKGNLASTKLLLDDSPSTKQDAQKIFAEILDGAQPFALAAVEWLRLELERRGGPDWNAVDARVQTGQRWINDAAAMNLRWNLLYWRFPDRSGELRRLFFNGDSEHPRDDRQCYWFALTQLARYLRDATTPLDWPPACAESQPARDVLAADFARIGGVHPEWRMPLRAAAAAFGLPADTDV